MIPMVKFSLMSIQHFIEKQCGSAGSRELNIDDKLSEGYIIGCDCEAYFIVPRLGVSVECPHCGHTELPAKMLTAWTLDTETRILFDAAD